ncbi:MAG: glycoside hydrolase family 15 protein [Candidatus Woesearchaeota archaeon]
MVANKIILKSLDILKSLRYQNGLFSASKKDVNTGYNMAWIRDNIYSCIGLENFDRELVIQTYRTMLDIFLKHEKKLDNAIANPPKNKMDYLHPRYHPLTLEELEEEWGNKQNDMVGSFLFKISELTQRGFCIIRDENDIRIIQKLVRYLDAINYYRDCDNGMWEENEEVHSSSVGACVAGLKKVKETEFRINKYKTKIFVPEELIQKGIDTLEVLLPRESVTKKVDMALLSLIWPYNITTKKQAEQILENVEKYLVRDKGVIRYVGDKYYYNNGEAEWTMGFPWLAIAYKKTGNIRKYKEYLAKSLNCQNKIMEMPELYFARSEKHNQNSPLAWAQSLLITAIG